MKNYRKGDVVYLSFKHESGINQRCGTCPAKYLGRFKDRFNMDGITYCFAPVGSAEDYAIARFEPEEVNGEILSSVIPFSIKPCCYGKVKR